MVSNVIGLEHEISQDADLGVALHGQAEDKRWVSELEKINTLDELRVENECQLTLDTGWQLYEKILLGFKLVKLHPHELVILLYADANIFRYLSYD